MKNVSEETYSKKGSKNPRLTMILPVVKYMQENPQKFAAYP